MPSTDYSTAQLARRPIRTASEDRVPLQQKIGYGFGTFVDMWGHWLYPNIAFQVFHAHLGVPATLVGIALILIRIFDSVYDPVFGWLSDNTRTRWGRRRPFLLAGSIVAGIGLPFLLCVTHAWGGTSHLFGFEISNYFWFMLLSCALYLPLVSCFNMPYVSLGNELTPDYNERTLVFTIKNAVQKLPEMGLFAAGYFYTLHAWSSKVDGSIFDRVKSLFTSRAAWHGAEKGTENQFMGAQVFLVFAGIVIMIAGLITFALTKERYYNKLVAGKQAKIPISETLWQTLKCKPFRAQIVMQLGYNMGTSMVGTLGFALTVYYVCTGDWANANGWNFWMGIMGMGMGFMGLPVFTIISKKFGKRHAMRAVMCAAIVAFIGSWWFYTPELVWLQIFAAGCIAFTGAGFWMLIYSVAADVVDYDELQTGRRREGAFAACSSWINKFAMAIGGGVSLMILDWIGVQKDLGGAQSEHTFFMMRILFLTIPICGLMVALIALAVFPLTAGKMAEIRTQLEARRGKV